MPNPVGYGFRYDREKEVGMTERGRCDRGRKKGERKDKQREKQKNKGNGHLLASRMKNKMPNRKVITR